MARRGLPRHAGPTSMAVPPPHPPNQSDANRKMSTWRATTHSTQLFLSAPAPLRASAAQWDPTPMEPSLCLPTSPQLPWVLVVPDSGELRLIKTGTRWLQSTPVQTLTFQDTLQQDLAILLPLSPA